MPVRVLPVVYACSGCSSAGQLADHVARQLDRLGRAEMASLAGIGAGDEQQLSRARSRFPIIALDGCVNACASRCLARNAVETSRSYVMTRYGGDAERALQAVLADAG